MKTEVVLEKAGDRWLWHEFGESGEVLRARTGFESKEDAIASIREIFGPRRKIRTKK